MDNILDFIRLANGINQKGEPKSTAVIAISELIEEEENGEIVQKSNILKTVDIIGKVITFDCFINGMDENAYVGITIKFDLLKNNDLQLVWNILKEYKEKNDLTKTNFDEDVEVDSEELIELIITPLETIDNPIFLELINPINFTLCSSVPNQVCDSINLFFNVDSAIIHEDLVDMNQTKIEAEKYLNELDEIEKLMKQIEEDKKSINEETIKYESEVRKYEMLNNNSNGGYYENKAD